MMLSTSGGIAPVAGLLFLAEGSDRTAKANIPQASAERRSPSPASLDIFMRISFTQQQSKIANAP
jgi:hypothetical protein